MGEKAAKVIQPFEKKIILAPILAYEDSNKPTVLKADCSGYSIENCFF
jgi:hypothetical protein